MESSRYGGLVWIVSGLSLLTYGGIGLFLGGVPGVEQLVAFISGAEGNLIFIAAFLAILIEGLYLIGSFFPGTTTIIVITIVSQLGGTQFFLGVIGSIYVGWVLASIINISIAYWYRSLMLKHQPEEAPEIKDRFWLTWFPAFRANYEVAQVTEGAHPLRVFLSTLRVKTIASALAAVGVLILPYIIDVTAMDNEEGFRSLGVIATIMLGVGIYKLREGRRTVPHNTAAD